MVDSSKPTHCCSRCFGDSGLGEIVRAHSEKRSTCGTCGSEDVDIADLSHVLEPFNLVVDAYSVATDSGLSLLECLQNDWDLFGNNAIKSEAQVSLLETILGREKASKKYNPLLSRPGSGDSDLYQEFRDELLNKNRWFIENSVLADDSEEFLSNLLYEIDEPLYRARVVESPDMPYVISEMGAPPASCAGGGRSNPVGISYLYLASNPDTAIAEVRSRVGHRVSVGKFRFEGLKVVDLSDMRRTYSPFVLDETSKVREHAEKLALFEAAAVEMSKPVTGREELEYLPTQYVCEMLKHLGFEGARYGSSQGEGHNFVLFNHASYKPEGVQTVNITGIKIETDERPSF